MGSILRQWKNRLYCPNKRNYVAVDTEVRNVYNRVEEFANENYLLKTQIDKLEERYHNEQIHILKRIEKLENDNLRFHENYQAYQTQNENCIQTITDLLVKILLTQQELRKQCIEQHNVNDAAHWRKQQDESVTQNAPRASCHLSSNQLDDSQYITNDQSRWLHERLMIVEEQDQKTTNYPLELNNYSSTLATAKSKSEKKSTTSTNKLYFVLNDEKITRDNQRSSVIDDSNIPHRKQQSSTMTVNKNRSAYSNHQKLPVQTPTANKTTTTPSISKPTRLPTTTLRPPTTNIRQRPSPANQKTVSTTNKPVRPRYTLAKPPEPPRPTRPRSGQAITNTIKPRIPTVVQQSARVTDLDAVIAAQQNKTPSKSTKVSSPSKINHIKPLLFSKNNVKIVRPVRSQELKLFSSHVKPDKPSQTKDSLSTLTPPSLELITDKNSSHNITSGIDRDFSADSLNEHYHIQQLLQQNASINTNDVQDHSSNENIQPTYVNSPNNGEGYFLLTDDNSNQSSSLIQPSTISPSKKSTIHRLVFPTRLGRMVFSRRVLSDSDIYQKNCSKDNEIDHNVYHLDTIRDYSMEFYMLTTYASDSQLRAWIDSNNDEIENNVCQLDENRFLQSDDDRINDHMKKLNSSDSLIRYEQELDWYSELEVLHLSSNSQQEKQDNSSSYSSDVKIDELLEPEQFSLPSLTNTSSIDSSTSTDLTSASWSTPNGTSNQPTPPPSNITDETNSILREILHYPWTDHSSSSNNIDQEADINQYENETTSSIITDEFQTDFYYLCPITNTISFSKTDYKPLYHDV